MARVDTSKLKRYIKDLDMSIRGDVFETSKEVMKLAKERLKKYTQAWYDNNPEHPEVYQRTYDFINSIDGKVTQSGGKYYIKVFFNTKDWRIENRGIYNSHADFNMHPIGERLIDLIENGFGDNQGTHAIKKTTEWLEKYINDEFMAKLKLKIGKKFGK